MFELDQISPFSVDLEELDWLADSDNPLRLV